MITFKQAFPRNESSKACTLCQGQCCRNLPGIVHPQQLEVITPEAILELLQSGYCVDWWEGDPRNHFGTTWTGEDEVSRAYYIRPRVAGIYHGKELADQVRQPLYGREGKGCIFLTPAGCSHAFENRPYECQALIPNKRLPGNCFSHIKDSKTGKQELSLAWLPYQAVIEKALDLYHDTPTK